MKSNLQLSRFLPALISSIFIVIIFAISSFAGDGTTIAWNTILPEENNISLQQSHAINSFEITLTELDSVIDQGLREGKISYDTDFTTNEDVSMVYDYLAYRIYELMKVDRKIREGFAVQEVVFKNTSSDVLKKYYSMRTDYENSEASFFSSLDNFKRIVFIKDLKAEIRNLKNSLRELKSAMNIYSKYSVELASR